MFSFSGYFTNGSDWERFGEGSPTCFSFIFHLGSDCVGLLGGLK